MLDFHRWAWTILPRGKRILRLFASPDAIRDPQRRPMKSFWPRGPEAQSRRGRGAPPKPSTRSARGLAAGNFNAVLVSEMRARGCCPSLDQMLDGWPPSPRLLSSPGCKPFKSRLSKALWTIGLHTPFALVNGKNDRTRRARVRPASLMILALRLPWVDGSLRIQCGQDADRDAKVPRICQLLEQHRLGPGATSGGHQVSVSGKEPPWLRRTPSK